MLISISQLCSGSKAMKPRCERTVSVPRLSASCRLEVLQARSLADSTSCRYHRSRKKQVCPNAGQEQTTAALDCCKLALSCASFNTTHSLDKQLSDPDHVHSPAQVNCSSSILKQRANQRRFSQPWCGTSALRCNKGDSRTR